LDEHLKQADSASAKCKYITIHILESYSYI